MSAERSCVQSCKENGGELPSYMDVSSPDWPHTSYSQVNDAPDSSGHGRPEASLVSSKVLHWAIWYAVTTSTLNEESKTKQKEEEETGSNEERATCNDTFSHTLMVPIG